MSKLEEALKAWKAQYGEPIDLAERRTPTFRRPIVLKRTCADAATRYGQDQYRCTQCGMIWDVDEPRPPCQDTQVQQPQRDRP